MLSFSFHFILVFTSELGKVSHFSSRLFVSSNLWKTGGKNLGLVFFQLNSRSSGFSVSVSLVAK